MIRYVHSVGGFKSSFTPVINFFVSAHKKRSCTLFPRSIWSLDQSLRSRRSAWSMRQFYSIVVTKLVHFLVFKFLSVVCYEFAWITKCKAIRFKYTKHFFCTFSVKSYNMYKFGVMVDKICCPFMRFRMNGARALSESIKSSSSKLPNVSPLSGCVTGFTLDVTGFCSAWNLHMFVKMFTIFWFTSA